VRHTLGCFATILCVCLGAPLEVSADVIDFESLADSQSVTNQFVGLTFLNTVALSAGIGLNEFEFPPRSGINVVLDDGGAISISFASAVAGVGGYFTYLTPVTLAAYDSSNQLLGSVSSAFSSNVALSGDGGSSPNEFLQLLGSEISSVTISGDPQGFSFTLDDLTVKPARDTVPEPAILSLVLMGGAGIARRASTRRKSLG